MRGNMTDLVKPIVLIALAVLLVLGLGLGAGELMGSNKPQGPAIDFTVNEFTLSEHYKDGVALIFINRTQGDGKTLLTNLAAAKEQTSVKTVLVAIGEESEESITDYLKENGLSCDIVISDKEGKIAALYNISTCPVTYFIDKEGQVRGVSLANLTPSAAKKYISYVAKN